jgi:hypothetical protein
MNLSTLTLNRDERPCMKRVATNSLQPKFDQGREFMPFDATEVAMQSEYEGNRDSAFDEGRGIRNPFNVMDVPNPDDREVQEFAASAELEGASDDENAKAWGTSDRDQYHSIEGNWSSRWNGGVDSTIKGDAKNKWKQGRAEVRTEGERVYLLFEWDHGARRGLIDARRTDATRLVGKYINLSDPVITRPWIGLIASNRRIDGKWPEGRLDFRR